MRVLYSFPHKIGAARICHIAWEQVNGLVAAGADVQAHPGAVVRRLPEAAVTRPTLQRGRFRIPYRALGRMRSMMLHDEVVARRLKKVGRQVDVVHAWPQAALRTLEVAAELGIPAFLERPNTHTRFAYEVVRAECERLGVELPPKQEHAYNAAILEREEAEFRHADFLLCPSDFVLQSFLDEGYSPKRLVRHIYGVDPASFFPSSEPHDSTAGLTALFAGVAAVRKGLHFALEAWLRSPASETGRFLIAGAILPEYGDLLAESLTHPSVHVLGHRSDVPDLMRSSDVFLLPSLEEGSALVCNEAIASGAVPLVSNMSSGLCRHLDNALVHRAGDVNELERHLTMVAADRGLLARLREGCRRSVPELTWAAAGRRLLQVYTDGHAAWHADRATAPARAADGRAG